MKTAAFSFALPILFAGASLITQGCYTRLAMVDDESEAYVRDEEKPAATDTTAATNDDQWYPHRYVGFEYYHPAWTVGYSYDPWYVDPWYDTPWGPGCGYYGWWGPPIVSYYYPTRFYYGGYGYSNWAYHNSGFRSGVPGSRAAGYRRTGGTVRTDYRGSASLPGGGSLSPAGGLSRGATVTSPGLPAAGTRRVDGRTVPTTRSTSPAATGATRRAAPATSRPAVQQPQHRDPLNGPSWQGGSRRGGNTRSTAPSSGSSGGRSSAPATAQPARPSAPPPSHSTPPPSNTRQSGSDHGTRR